MVRLFQKYHGQIALALKQPEFSVPEYWNKATPMPWANLPTFDKDMKDTDYPDFAKKLYFDGLFEQAHDNYHGWVGGDMVS